MTTEYTTDYVSPFPSGFMNENIQAERRSDSPATVAAARDYNRHDVEILRIQEVIGLEPAAQSGVPNPTGDIYSVLYQNYQDIYNIIHGSGVAFSGAANQIPFHNNPSDPNYQFMQWFLEWMGIWDWLSVSGTPSIEEVVKALWQNKYEVEVMFDPKFLWPAEGDGINSYVTKTLQEPLSFFAGFSGSIPVKPIGAFCDLDYRPYPIYQVQDGGSYEYYEGYVTLPSGTALRFWTDAAAGLIPHASTNYEVSLFGNYPHEFAIGGGPVLLEGDPLATPPPGSPPEPTAPTGHGVPSGGTGILGPGYPGPIDVSGGIPWAEDDPYGWEPLPEGPVDTPIEIGNIIIAPPLKGIHDNQGNIQISSIDMQSLPPVPQSGIWAPGAWVQLDPIIWGVSTQVDGAKFSLIGPAKTWVNFYMTVGIPATEPPGVYIFNNPNTFVYKFAYTGVPTPIPSVITFALDPLAWPLDAGLYLTIPIAQVYCEEKMLLEGHFIDDPPGSSIPAVIIGFSAELVGYKGD